MPAFTYNTGTATVGGSAVQELQVSKSLQAPVNTINGQTGAVLASTNQSGMQPGCSGGCIGFAVAQPTNRAIGGASGSQALVLAPVA